VKNSPVAIVAWDNTEGYHKKLLWAGRMHTKWRHYDAWLVASNKKDAFFNTSLEFASIRFIWWFWLKTKFKEIVNKNA
jgi:hypothetical protein